MEMKRMSLRCAEQVGLHWPSPPAEPHQPGGGTQEAHETYQLPTQGNPVPTRPVMYPIRPPLPTVAHVRPQEPL